MSYSLVKAYQNDTHKHYSTIKTTLKNRIFLMNLKNKHNINFKIQVNKSRTYAQIMVKLCKILEQVYILHDHVLIKSRHIQV